MGTEVWFRNPDNYIKELVEVGVYHIVWDRGILVKKRIDPAKHASLYFGKTYPWRALLVGDQGTAELSDGYTLDHPKAVYPTWEYGEDGALLEEMIAQPVGADQDLCMDMSVPPDERPVFGQEHRVVVINLPAANSGPGRAFLRYLKEMQEDYPECKIHVHGLYGWRPAFGLGFASADVEPRTSAQKGKVILPSGKEERFEEVVKHPQWATAVGYRPVDLQVPRVRCMFNIRSAIWASENYGKLYNFPVRRVSGTPDTTSPTAAVVPIETRSHIIGADTRPAAGDMISCDSCSMSDKCRYFREGSVCGVPSSESSALAKHFRTRDSNQIIDGLGKLMEIGTERLERGLEGEQVWGELDPEVSKQLNALFEQGKKLAQLVNPELRGGARVNVNLPGSHNSQVTMVTPQAFVAGAIAELEKQGFSRDQITPDMIAGMLEGMANPKEGSRIIEATAISSETERSA